jgi:3-hydroxyisobutyrate dehydrogenase-like beta-hydroxyacid dehydrogenase/drug/metabolite transporter (DMT)-like permease
VRQTHVSTEAILLILGSVLCFTLLDTITKFTTRLYPVPVLIWARFAVQFLAMLVWLGPSMGIRLLRTRRLTMQLIRRLVMLLSSFMFVSALRVLPLADATAINYSTPVLVIVLAVVFLHERMTLARGLFVFAGIAGMLLIVQPGSDVFQGGSLYAIGGACCYGTYQILTRKLAGENPRVLLFYPALMGTIVMTALAPAFDWPQHMPWQHVALIVLGWAARHPGPFPVHTGVPARAGVGADALHVHATRVGHAAGMVRVRRLSRCPHAHRHGHHRHERTADHAARAAPRAVSHRRGDRRLTHSTENAMSKPRIGFVGIGLMGHGIAKNLVAKGYPLTLRIHRNRKPAEDLLAAGAKEAGSYKELAEVSDIVFLCVTGAPQVEEVVFGADGLASAARQGLTIIDTSTSEPAVTARTREALAPKGVRFVDAPLARTPVEAEAGRLNIMVGADEATFAELKPVLSAFCENIIHAGPPGHGHVLKLVNNFLAQAICTATAEACATAAKSGLSLRKLHEVVSAGAVNSGLFQMVVGKLLESGDLTGLKFSLSNAAKDLRYYTHLTESLMLPSVVGEAVHQSLVIANSLGFGEKFVPSLIEAQEKLAGVSIVKRP